MKDGFFERPEIQVEATLTGKAFHVALVVVMRREWLYANDGEKGHSISEAPPAELKMAHGGGPPSWLPRTPPTSTASICKGRRQRSHLCVSVGDRVVSNQSL